MAKDKNSKKRTKDDAAGRNRATEDMTEDQQTALQPRLQQDIQQSFDTLYLQQASKEFADDLEKLRTANDFKGERSVHILVDALRQGTTCYSEDEKRRIMRG